MGDTRRDFIKKSAFAAAGLAAAATMPISAKSYSRILGANDKVVVGLVGFSDRAKNSLVPPFMGYSERLNFEIKGLSDIWNRRRNEGVEFFKSKYNKDVVTYLNNDELYNDKDIDAVIISTADFQHAIHAIEAANNKKDAYVEKPFAETMEDNRNALKAVKESGIILQIGSQRRSGSNYHAANDFIKSGKFGDIKMVEMSWNVNQPGRWRRPDLVSTIKETDVDWKRYLINRPLENWDPRKYVEYRLFWPYSSGIPGQWMSHQIDTVHWFSGYNFPRSVSANGGIYMWNDGRKNFDAMTAVFDYGPEDDMNKGFQVVYSSRMFNSAGGVKEIYYSNGGELNLDTNKVTANGGLTEQFAKDMKMKSNQLADLDLSANAPKAITDANTGTDPMTSAHMLNWMESVRDRKTPHGPVEAGYYHSVANIMTTAALRTKKFIQYDKNSQEVLADGKVFKY
ncbi:oxidoreductase [bacterium BRH_c32]|nr:MAG: oxidoreductase [bacterium BRH_c32]